MSHVWSRILTRSVEAWSQLGWAEVHAEVDLGVGEPTSGAKPTDRALEK